MGNPVFAFGENSARFLTSLSDGQIGQATRAVSAVIARDLRDKTFLHIGSDSAVATAQAIALGDAQTLLTIRQSRLVASVALIQALGGGWDAASIGTPRGTAATLANEATRAH